MEFFVKLIIGKLMNKLKLANNKHKYSCLKRSVDF